MPNPQAPKPEGPQEPPAGSLTNTQNVSGEFDSRRSVERYRKAEEGLKKMLKNFRQYWDGSNEFPELDTLQKNEDISILQKEIETFFTARECALKNKSTWSIVKGII